MNSLTFDRVGGLASSLCALHCLVMSAAPALLTLLGVEVLADEAFEWGFFAAALAAAALAAALGYRQHQSVGVLAGFSVGALALVAGRLGEALSLFSGATLVVITGGLILVGSHVVSARRTRACQRACCS